jgi:hypothetical protein
MNVEMRLLRTGSLAVMTLLFGYSSLHAQGIVWSTAAMACVPTGGTAEQAKYITTAGGVKFKDGASGAISFVCPVSGPLQDGDYNVAGLVDVTFPSDYGVKFLLRRAHKTTGAVTTLIESNAVRWPSDRRFKYVERDNEVAVNFDFDTYIYWVQLTNQVPSLSILAVELRRVR